jgi:hypothetical protein
VPRFFFHVLDDLDTTDDEGAELPDVQTARQWATSAARTLMCETLKSDGRITLHHRIEIENSQHRTIATVRFGDAVEIVR